MAYSEKVMSHYNEPRNVGSLDKKSPDVGTGLVGAPECGDVMQLQILIDDQNKIEDARFKTFGCLSSETKILTSEGWRFIRSFEVGEKVFAFNGEGIVENEIVEIVENRIHIKDTLMIETDRPYPDISASVICSKDHIFWSESNRPIEAIELVVGDSLMASDDYLPRVSISSNFVKRITEINSIKELDSYFEDFKPSGPMKEGDYLIMFDLHLRDGAHVYIAEGMFVHNCGSAIASSSLATEWIKGRTIEEAMSIDNKMIVEELSLPPVKIHCSVLAEDAIKAAIADYRKKQASKIVEEADLIEEVSESVATDLDVYENEGGNVRITETLESKL